MVSVIVPVYNVEKYLSRCLDSIINQTYRDLQIICINDGSKDSMSCIFRKSSFEIKCSFVIIVQIIVNW